MTKINVKPFRKSYILLKSSSFCFKLIYYFYFAINFSLIVHRLSEDVRTCMWAPYPGLPMKIQSVLLDSATGGRK